MAREPEDRFASAEAMSAALRAGAEPSAGRLARGRILALATVAGLAVALIAVAVAIGGGDSRTLPGGTPAVTGPPPTLLSPPTSENQTSTSTASTSTASTSTETTHPDRQRGKGKAKGKD